MTLGNFLNVAGSGERIKIGFRSKNGFKFDNLVIHLYDNIEVQNLYDFPVYNIYTFDDVEKSGMIIVLDDIGK